MDLPDRRTNPSGTDFISASSSRITFARKLENLIFFGLLGIFLLLAATPASVDSQFKWFFVVTISLLAAFRLLENTLRHSFCLSDPLLLAPLFGILLLSVLQIIPFAFWIDPAVTQKTISLDEFGTRKFIVIYGGLLLAFEILIRYSVTRRRLAALIYLILTISVGSIIFGYFRHFFLGDIATAPSALVNQGSDFAQFANRNHFALLIEMCSGLLWGLLLKGRLSAGLKFAAWMLMALMFLAVISANSRGAIVTTLMLSVFAVFTHLLTSKSHSNSKTGLGNRFSHYLKTGLIALTLSAVVLGISLFTIALLGGETVIKRIETLNSELEPNQGLKVRRREIWESTAELIRDYPITGVGFGAYPAAITGYDKSPGYFSLEQAHNDYLEVLANGGALAFLLLIVFLIVVFKKAFRQLAAKDDLRRGSCFGAIVGISGALVHSMFDFGLQVPINAIVFLILVTIATQPIVTAEND